MVILYRTELKKLWSATVHSLKYFSYLDLLNAFVTFFDKYFKFNPVRLRATNINFGKYFLEFVVYIFIVWYCHALWDLKFIVIVNDVDVSCFVPKYYHDCDKECENYVN